MDCLAGGDLAFHSPQQEEKLSSFFSTYPRETCVTFPPHPFLSPPHWKIYRDPCWHRRGTAEYWHNFVVQAGISGPLGKSGNFQSSSLLWVVYILPYESKALSSTKQLTFPHKALSPCTHFTNYPAMSVIANCFKSLSQWVPPPGWYQDAKQSSLLGDCCLLGSIMWNIRDNSDSPFARNFFVRIRKDFLGFQFLTFCVALSPCPFSFL